LGDVEEWTVIAHNDFSFKGEGPSHPFHIHVNPFEIVSIVDVQGNDKNPWKGPVWKDTIVLNEGEKVTFRTRYQDFDGIFVQHCHILDHEDQGMMELIQIINPTPTPTLTDIPKPYKAPAMILTDALGGVHCWDSDKLKKTTVVFLFEKLKCLACSRQIGGYWQLFEKFQAADIDVIAVSSGTPEELYKGLKKKNQRPIPFQIYADSTGKIFRDYGCMGLHGTFIIDNKGNIRWQIVSIAPDEEVEKVLEKAIRV